MNNVEMRIFAENPDTEKNSFVSFRKVHSVIRSPGYETERRMTKETMRIQLKQMLWSSRDRSFVLNV